MDKGSTENMALLEKNRYDSEENAVFLDYSKSPILSDLSNFKTLSLYRRIALAKNVPSIFSVIGDCEDFRHFLFLLVSVP